MSVLQKAKGLFSRNKPGEPASINTLSGPDVQPELPLQAAPTQKLEPAIQAYPAPQKESDLQPGPVEAPQKDDVIYIYSHGFTNGLYRIAPEKDSFEQFLEYSCRVDRIKSEREQKERDIINMELKFNAATSAFALDTHLLIEKEKHTEHMAISVAAAERQRDQSVDKEATIATQIRETISEYSWVPALLYLFAGITFIIADISITHQITAWGFDMGDKDGWIFAVGLAFTAFLIKPAIDRLLEKPFQASGLKLKTVYKYVLLGITLIGLTMLFALGKFRSDSEKAKNQLQDLTEQMASVPPSSQAYQELKKKYDGIQDSLDNNTWGQAGLILSGMLFAIGGAICLSISFGSLKHLINRYWILPLRIRRLKKEIKIQAQQIENLKAAHTSSKIEQGQAEKRLSLNDTKPLKDDLDRLKEERFQLIAEYYKVQFEKERTLYIDGRNKGEKYELDGTLKYTVPEIDQSSINLGKKTAKADHTASFTPRLYTRRPFIKMRKMIADNYNKNQNTSSYDESEFEIIS